MTKVNFLIKTLAVLGTIISWIPILAPLVFSIIRLLFGADFRFDYLMPAELFPVALVGCILLTIAAANTHFYRKLIYTCFGLSVSFLIFTQGFAILTGLASGRIEVVGWQWFLVLFSLALYTFSLVGIGTGGILILKKIFLPNQH